MTFSARNIGPRRATVYSEDLSSSDLHQEEPLNVAVGSRAIAAALLFAKVKEKAVPVRSQLDQPRQDQPGQDGATAERR
ncbi:hypothetical protein FHW96_001088 [Novosphingobium sp. SG751A]|uniref:hypothetical protein n=1 Tax=Novosphingobium sp. SG751A TaxID=2587000 RepID=UPI0015516F37|nr:hypothetical protein [Novosphingobium sp. SG751A]NOW44942.1 hypothetical protein [Novosphingobium sp. SG751A]